MARVTSSELLAAIKGTIEELAGDDFGSLDLRGSFAAVGELARAELEAELLPDQYAHRNVSEERQIKGQLDAIHAQKGTPYTPDNQYQ